MTVSVLGTEYEVSIKSRQEDKTLQNADGYCDKTSKRIVVCGESEDNELDNFATYQKQCLRHEIIHAFLFESGLATNWEHKTFGHDETYVDWIAAQFPKLKTAFEVAGAL